MRGFGRSILCMECRSLFSPVPKWDSNGEYIWTDPAGAASAYHAIRVEIVL
jgi:hypothetical protein